MNCQSHGASSCCLWLILLGTRLIWPGVTLAGDFDSLCADRTAVERVYYQHRLGEKPSFEQACPPARIAQWARDELRQEAVLKKVYGVDVAELLPGEVARINATTQAPEMLAEIKAALGNDPQKFAEVFARPVLVQRTLRERFANDDALHAPVRRACEQARRECLAARTNGTSPSDLLSHLQSRYSNAVTAITWQLGARPAAPAMPATAGELGVKQRIGPGDGGGHDQFYFADLPAELQNVLRVQLRRPGDVSAVIETPDGFEVYLLQAMTRDTWQLAVLSMPKRNFDQWLAEQEP